MCVRISSGVHIDSGNDDEPALLSPQAPLPPSSRPLLQAWEQVAQDAWTVARLALQLSTYLFRGLRWYIQFVRLVVFAALLLPGFAQMGAFYFFSRRVLRSVCYGPAPRNRLDVYLPRRHWRASPCPVLIYVTGGAWLIGYKAWGALFGRRLSQRGVLVFCLDYRNFPQGRALEMAADVNTGIAWVLEHAHLYGGDAGDVTLVGQSAGGHLAALCLLSQCAQAARAGGQGPPAAAPAAAPRWDPARIKAFVGVSGAYDLVALEDHFHGRGLYRTLYRSIMHDRSGAPALAALSPTQLARALPPPAAAALPRVLLLHGDRDASVPPRVAAEFAAALRAAGAEVAHKSYAGKTHTQPIVEDPMRGGRDELMDDVLGVVRGRACHNRQFGLLPAALIDLATAVCPF